MKVILLVSVLVCTALAEDKSANHIDGEVEGRATRTVNINDVNDLIDLNLGTLNLDNLQFQKPDLSTITTDDPFGNLLLAIGNVLGLFNDIPGLNELLTELANAGIDGIPATIIASIAAISIGKASFLGLLLKPLQIANQVLAIISIALLGTYLVESEGDFTGLIRRSFDESVDYSYNYATYSAEGEDDQSYYTNSLEGGRSLANPSILQRIGNLAHKAFETYENLNA